MTLPDQLPQKNCILLLFWVIKSHATIKIVDTMPWLMGYLSNFTLFSSYLCRSPPNPIINCFKLLTLWKSSVAFKANKPQSKVLLQLFCHNLILLFDLFKLNELCIQNLNFFFYFFVVIFLPLAFLLWIAPERTRAVVIRHVCVWRAPTWRAPII